MFIPTLEKIKVLNRLNHSIISFVQCAKDIDGLDLISQPSQAISLTGGRPVETAQQFSRIAGIDKLIAIEGKSQETFEFIKEQANSNNIMGICPVEIIPCWGEFQDKVLERTIKGMRVIDFDSMNLFRGEEAIFLVKAIHSMNNNFGVLRFTYYNRKIPAQLNDIYMGSILRAMKLKYKYVQMSKETYVSHKAGISTVQLSGYGESRGRYMYKKVLNNIERWQELESSFENNSKNQTVTIDKSIMKTW